MGIVYLTFRGFSTEQAFNLTAYFAIATAILEYPTGVIGDYLGHRTSLMFGQFLFVLAHLLLAFHWNIPVYYLLFTLLALSMALSSGSDIALLHKLSDDFKRDSSNYNFVMIGFLLVSAVSGGILAKYNVPAIVWTSAITALIALLVLSTINVPNIKSSKGNIFLTARKGLSVVYRSRTLSLILIYSAFIVSIQSSLKSILSSFGSTPEYSVEIIGIIIGGLYVIRVIATEVFKRSSYINDAYIIICITFLLILSLVFGSFPYLSLILFSVIGFFTTILYLNSTVKINEMVSDEVRASVLSLRSLVIKLLASGLLIIIGRLLGVGRFDWLLLFYLFLIAIIGYISFLSSRKLVVAKRS